MTHLKTSDLPNKEEIVKTKHLRCFGIFMICCALILSAGCKKKVVANAPAPPPIAAPTASISADPSSIEKGQFSTLRWETSNADDVSIEGLGKVDANGEKRVSPSESVTYELTAKGAGGTASASARVTVTMPPPPPPTAQAVESESDLFARSIKNIFFDFDKSDIRADQQGAIDSDTQFLQSHSGIKVLIEGHCDERGSVEYNVALGDRRANSVKQALVRAGVAADRVRTISYGKERPFCSEHTEDCWQQNRQGHFVYQPPETGRQGPAEAPTVTGTGN
jgi:peptidoglycan-associated lipoprotein